MNLQFRKVKNIILLLWECKLRFSINHGLPTYDILTEDFVKDNNIEQDNLENYEAIENFEDLPNPEEVNECISIEK